MRIFLDNVNTSSSSGPNSFGRALKQEIEKTQLHQFSEVEPDVQLSFITSSKKLAPLALRLDGIYFNTRQDWHANNEPIKRSFEVADSVIYQSEFNKRLTEKYFGVAKKSFVIGNGTCTNCVMKMDPIQSPVLDRFSEVWSCSSSWRPHKRLKENVRYFLEKAPEDSCLVVAGENPDYVLKHPRVMYVGHLPWDKCIALYRRSKVFLHLSFLDHCPNVVVDARAAGCNIVVSSSGGTREIAGPNANVVQDLEWDMRPLDLYDPPDLDLTKCYRNGLESTIDIREVASKYVDCLLETMRVNEKTNS